MAGLNRAQQEAVQTTRGPLLVLAGAGTGKTRVVTFRIVELIRHGVSAERILAVTFTNKAAAEMLERASHLLGKTAKKRPLICTFHALCMQILRRHATRLGYPERFAIYDAGDQSSLARKVLRELKMPEVSLRPADMLAHFSRWKNAGVRPEQASALAASDEEHLAASAYRRYQRKLKLAGAVDFDDLLLLTEELFTRFPEALAEESGRFDHLLIDEYQDTNGSQYRIVKALAARHRNLCVVGDDDQAIYGWRGAEVEHILSFRRDWPEARVVTLTENYRSVGPILQMANRLIAFNRLRHPKALEAARTGGAQPRILEFLDETQEAKMVADEIAVAAAEGATLSDYAILFRTNEQPRLFEQELRRRKLPYVLVGSKSFFDRAEVRDVLAYLKVLSQPRDEISLRRILNTPPRGIGEQSVDAIVARSQEREISLWDALPEAAEQGLLSGKAAEAVRGFRGLVQGYQTRSHGGGLAALTQELLRDIGYFEALTAAYDSPEERQARQQSVEELVNALAQYEQQAERPRLDEFLDQMALADFEPSGDKEKQLKRNAVALLTMHSAKGLEFPCVYLVGLEEGILPHKRSLVEETIDEERRLCYVGVTRAKDRLTLTLAKSRMKWGKPRACEPSRFLYELTGRADNPHASGASKPRGKPAAARGKGPPRRGI